MKTAAKIIVAGVSTIALACGIGAGIAYADPPTPTPTPKPTASASQTPTAKPRDPDRWEQRRMRRLAAPLLRRALHGEVTLAGEQHRVVAFQRGPVEKVGDTSLTVRSSDGYTATYVVSGDTTVRRNGAKATIAELKPGDRVVVVANKDGSTLNAVRIRAID
jgi:uncharacterized Zn-binding protein involved in type VI secretion